MHPRPRLTPDEHRSIRNWSFAMAIIYSLFILAVFASVAISPAPPAAHSAVTGAPPKTFFTTQSADVRQPPTDATTQR